MYDEIFLPLFGAHQASNAAVALAAVEAFLGGGESQFNPELVREGFAAVPVTRAASRWSARGPTVVVDAAHNPHGARALAEAIQDGFDFHLRSWAVVAVLEGKDARGLCSWRSSRCSWRSSSPRPHRRGRWTPTCSPRWRSRCWGRTRVEVVPRLADALDTAIERADEAAAQLDGGTGVLVTGSVVTAAEARAMLGRAEA